MVRGEHINITFLPTHQEYMVEKLPGRGRNMHILYQYLCGLKELFNW